MSRDASGRVDNTEREKKFMIKKEWKLKKTKSKDERIESDVPKKNSNISSPFLFSFFVSFSNIFMFVFPIKMRGVYG